MTKNELENTIFLFVIIPAVAWFAALLVAG